MKLEKALEIFCEGLTPDAQAFLNKPRYRHDGRSILEDLIHIAHQPRDIGLNHSSHSGVIGDIHGDIHSFIDVLVHMGAADQSLNWTGNVNTLELLGDLVDRGEEPFHVLALSSALSIMANDAGQKASITLGNHDIDKLNGHSLAQSLYTEEEKGSDAELLAMRDIIRNNLAAERFQIIDTDDKFKAVYVHADIRRMVTEMFLKDFLSYHNYSGIEHKFEERLSKELKARSWETNFTGTGIRHNNYQTFLSGKEIKTFAKKYAIGFDDVVKWANRTVKTYLLHPEQLSGEKKELANELCELLTEDQTRYLRPIRQDEKYNGNQQKGWTVFCGHRSSLNAKDGIFEGNYLIGEKEKRIYTDTLMVAYGNFVRGKEVEIDQEKIGLGFALIKEDGTIQFHEKRGTQKEFVPRLREQKLELRNKSFEIKAFAEAVVDALPYKCSSEEKNKLIRSIKGKIQAELDERLNGRDEKSKKMIREDFLKFMKEEVQNYRAPKGLLEETNSTLVEHCTRVLTSNEVGQEKAVSRISTMARMAKIIVNFFIMSVGKAYEESKKRVNINERAITQKSFNNVMKEKFNKRPEAEIRGMMN